MHTTAKKPNATDLTKQVMALRSEVAMLRDTVNNLMMILVEKELEMMEDEEEIYPDETALGKFRMQHFN